LGHCPALLVTRIDASSTEHVRRRDFSVEHLLAVSRRVKPGTQGQGLAGSPRAPASRRRRAPGILAGVRVRGYHRRLVFLQLPGVPQRHRSPPQLAWRPEQRRPYLERRGHHGTSPLRHPSPDSGTRKRPSQMAIRSNPDRPWPIERTPGTQGVDGK